MKVLQINSVYKTGSTGNLVYELHKYLKKNAIESVVCYGRGELVYEASVYKTCGEYYSKINQLIARFRGQLYSGCYLSTIKLVRIIKREKPDVVHLQCINGFFVNIFELLEWLKKKKIKTVLTLHAEFMFTANCGHARECMKWVDGCGDCPRIRDELKSFGIDGTHNSWVRMQEAFRGFGENLKIVSVSPWLMKRAKQSPFLKSFDHYVIFNGVDTKVFHRRSDNTRIKTKRNENTKIVLFVTPFFSLDANDLKGGRYLNQLAELCSEENVEFWVVGQYQQGIIVSPNIHLVGRIDDQNCLAEYYSLANVTVLLSLRETFSMVTAESLCCGTPVVGFKAGGPEEIAIKEYTDFVEQGDVMKLYGKMRYWLFNPVNRNKIGEEAIEKYSSDIMSKAYQRLYCSMLE